MDKRKEYTEHAEAIRIQIGFVLEYPVAIFKERRLRDLIVSIAWMNFKYRKVMSQEELFCWRMVNVILREEMKEVTIKESVFEGEYGTFNHIPGCGKELILEIDVHHHYINFRCPFCEGKSELFNQTKKYIVHAKEINNANT